MVTRSVVLLLIGSIVSLIWMGIGGLVSYVPGVITSNEMQDIYLSRIFWYGSLSSLLQFAAIALIGARRNRLTGARNLVE